MSETQLQMREQGRQGKKALKAFLPRKRVFFASLCERVQEPRLVCGFAGGCKAQPSPAPHSRPAQAHGTLAASSSLLWGCRSKSHAETPHSPPGRAQESQCPMQGLASTPELSHFQLRTKPNQTQPPGPCISMGKIS